MATENRRTSKSPDSRRLSIPGVLPLTRRVTSRDGDDLRRDRRRQSIYSPQEQITTLVHPSATNLTKLPPALSAIATTENSREHYTFYKKSTTGSGRYPVPKDIEHEAGYSKFQSTSGPANEGVVELLHGWKQGIHDGAVTAIVSSIGRPQGGSRGSEGRLIWLHVREPVPSIELLKDKFETKLASFVPLFIQGTIRSVLERLCIVQEREFKLGRYLVPGLIRYTADSIHTGYQDNPCMFLNFPFLALGKFESEGLGKINHPHPVRSLLQWRYRLESMAKRDQLQSIKSLKDEEILEAVGMERSATNLARLKEEKEVHVPQLWSLSISGDILVTSGPFTQEELCSSYLEMRDVDHLHPPLRKEASVVKIWSESEGESRITFLFSADVCESYFALLDKKHKVESTLGLSPADERRATTYDLVYRRPETEEDGGLPENVTSSNWCRILRSHQTDCVDLWMQALTPIVATTNSDDESGDESSSSLPSGAPTDFLAYLTDAPSPNTSPAAFTSRDRNQAPGVIDHIQPFTTWVFLTEYTSGTTISEAYKVNLWLNKILYSVHRSHGRHIDRELKGGLNVGSTSRGSYDSIAPITGNSLNGVLDLCPTTDSQTQTTHQKNSVIESQISELDLQKCCQELVSQCRDLIMLWVPDKIYPADDAMQGISLKTLEHPLTRLYWGLISRIITKTCEGHIGLEAAFSLCDALRDARAEAVELHYGVWKEECNSDQADDSKVSYSERAFVQPPVMEAFERLLNMLFKLIKKTGDNTKSKTFGKADMTETTQKKLKKYSSSLQTARKNLISDTEDARDQSYLGPLVTPEAITILLLGRLSKGHYRDKCVNFIDVYEKIVEQVASKIEKKYSRFLLIEINRVQEELEILLAVLKEQHHFMQSYSYHLDPANIDRYTRRREAAFRFEEPAIQRVQKDIMERIDHCNELLDRVKSLAQKNLRLVESYQDDNNRKLMIFTVVNIIFLPLGFVAGFFGMNVHGVVDTSYTTKHFWAVAAPLTGSIVAISAIMLSWEWIRGSVLGKRGV